MSETIELTKKLINLKSVTPNDNGCQKLIADYLADLGFTMEHMPFSDVNNLWARYGTETPVFCFAGHTDVVPAGLIESWETNPFTATEKDGYLVGRGAADMKTSIAAMMVSVKDFFEQNKSSGKKFKGSIAFLITSDEEGIAINGTKKVIDTLEARNEKIDYCLVGEPSSTNTVGDVIKNGRRGSITGHLTINGQQGHVAYPHLADNALHKTLLFMDDLVKHEWDTGYDNFPATSLQITNLEVHNNTSNVIPGKIEVWFNLRFNPTQTPDAIKAKVNDYLEKHKLVDCHNLEWSLSGLSFYCEDNYLTKAAVDAIKSVKKIDAELSTAGGTSDGRFIAPTGTKVIELGLVNATIHKVNEKVKLKEIDELKDIYLHTLMNLF